MYVLLCCWVAAVGAGLLKSEEILEGVTRVSISNDLEFEEQNFIALMTEARQVCSVYYVYFRLLLYAIALPPPPPIGFLHLRVES